MPGAIESLGFSPNKRMLMFYGICIPLRMSIAYSAELFHEETSFRIIAFLSFLFSIYSNISGILSENTNPVWWNRKLHLISPIIGILILLSGKTQFLSRLLFIDVAYGVINSLEKNPW